MDRRLEKIIREVFSLKEDGKIERNLTSDSIPAWDSLGHLNLIVAIEKEFKVKFEIEDMFKIKSLGDIEELLKRKIT